MYQSIISQTCEYQGFIFKNVRVDPLPYCKQNAKKCRVGLSTIPYDAKVYICSLAARVCTYASSIKLLVSAHIFIAINLNLR